LKPTISVLLLSYNHSRYIRSAVLSALKQETTDCKIEVDIIDDGSTDGTKEILSQLKKDYPNNIRLILSDHGGLQSVSKNFNFLIEKSRGRYLAFLASDDMYSDNRFNRQLNFLESDPLLVVVYADGVNLYRGELGERLTKGLSHAALKTQDPVKCFRVLITSVSLMWIQSLLIRSDFLKKIKPFDENLISDDWIFNINVFRNLVEKKLKFKYIDDIVFYRNIHKENTSGDGRTHFHRVQQVCDKYIDKSYTAKILSECAANFLIISFKYKDAKNFLYFFIKYIRFDISLNFFRNKIIKILKGYF